VHPPARASPQAIGLTTGNTLTAPGFYMLACTLLSIVAGVAIIILVPESNRSPKDPAADLAVAVEQA
jgi:hypothetical protein